MPLILPPALQDREPMILRLGPPLRLVVPEPNYDAWFKVENPRAKSWHQLKKTLSMASRYGVSGGNELRKITPVVPLYVDEIGATFIDASRKPAKPRYSDITVEGNFTATFEDAGLKDWIANFSKRAGSMFEGAVGGPVTEAEFFKHTMGQVHTPYAVVIDFARLEIGAKFICNEHPYAKFCKANVMAAEIVEGHVEIITNRHPMAVDCYHPGTVLQMSYSAKCSLTD